MASDYFDFLKQHAAPASKITPEGDSMATLTIKVDIAAKVLCDGDFIDLVDANEVKKIPIELGQHLITVESENVDGISEDREVSIEEAKNYVLIIKDLRTKEVEIIQKAEEKRFIEEQERKVAELKKKEEEEEQQRLAAECKKKEEEERQKREEEERLRIERLRPYCIISYRTVDGEMLDIGYLLDSFGTTVVAQLQDSVDSNWWEIEFELPLTSIPANAFSYDTCKKKLLSIKLPQGLESIGTKAFLNQSELVHVEMPDSVKEIEGEAFKNCSALMTSDPFSDFTLTLPKSLVRIGAEAFCGLSGIQHISFGDKVEVLDEGCFSQCTNLRGATLPDSVEKIGIACFSECTALRDIVIGSRISSIFTLAFKNCINLESVVFRSRICPSISVNSFYGCKNFRAEFACKVDKDSYRACKELDGRKDWGLLN